MTVSTLRRRQIPATPHDWHVIDDGEGPFLLFLHGAGGSSGSMEGMMRHLACDYRVFAPDLPGHGQTRAGSAHRFGLLEMADDIARLVRHETTEVFGVVGHSAGAAIALSLVESLSPRGQVLINPALEPFKGMTSWLFPGLAKLLAGLPFASNALSATLAQHGAVERLLRANGTSPTIDQITRYRRLIERPTHIAGTLRMMAQWNLSRDLLHLSRIDIPTLVLCGENDPTIPPEVGRRAAKQMINARFEIRHGGHLAHEEHPHEFAQTISGFFNSLKTRRNHQAP